VQAVDQEIADGDRHGLLLGCSEEDCDLG